MEKITKYKIGLIITVVMIVVILFYFLILPKYNQIQKDIGKMDLIKEMVRDNKIATDYLNCNVEIDWENRKENYKNLLINNNPQVNEENLIKAVNQIIDAEKEQCKNNNLIIYYQKKF